MKRSIRTLIASFMIFLLVFSMVSGCSRGSVNKEKDGKDNSSTDASTAKTEKPVVKKELQVLFEDNFDAANDKWIVQGGKMSVANGVATLDGMEGDDKFEHRYIWLKDIGTDVIAEAKFKIVKMDKFEATKSEPRIGVITHCKGESGPQVMEDFKWIALLADGQFRVLNEWYSWLAGTPYEYKEGDTFTIKHMTIKDKSYAKIWRDGEEEPKEWIHEVVQAGQFGEQGVGFYFPSSIIELDYFKVTESPELPPQFEFGKVSAGNIFITGQTPEVEVVFDNSQNKMFSDECSFEYKITDYLGNEINKGSFKINPVPGEVSKEKITLPGNLKYGQYIIDCSMAVGGKVAVSKTTSVAVIDKSEAVLAKESPFGIGSYGSFLGQIFEEQDINDAYAIYEKIGVKWTREEFFWDKLKPSKASGYNWKRIDSNIIAAREHKVNIMGLLDYWASWSIPYGDRKNTEWNEALANIKQYATDVVNRYKPNGEFSKEKGWNDGYGITSWEIWNEPETKMFWEGTAEEFGRVVKAVSEGIKAADPNAFILSSSWNASFDKTVLDVAGKDSYHGLTVHFYSRKENAEKGNNYQKKIVEYKNWLKENVGADQQVWMTETGWDTVNDVTELEQANNLVRANMLGIASGLDKVFTFTFRFGSPAEGWGIMTTNLDPKAAVPAYAAMAKRLEGKKFYKEPADMGRDIKAVIFEKDGKPTWSIWTTSGTGDVEVSLDAGAKSTVYDMMGNKLNDFSGKVNIKISESPVYIDTEGITPAMVEGAIKSARITNMDPMDIKISEIKKFPSGENLPTLDIQMVNRINEVWNGTVSLELPEGWKVDKQAQSYGELKPAGVSPKLSFKITEAKPTDTGDYPIKVVVTNGNVKFEKTFTYQLYAAQNKTLQASGNISGWSGLIKYRLDNAERIYEKKAEWKKENLSAIAVTAWDDTYFYINLEVDDDVHSQAEGGVNMINGDSVQLFFDPKNDKGGENSSDDRWYGACLKNDGTEEFYNIKAGLASNKIEGKITRDESSKKTIYELKVKWFDLKVEPKIGMKLNFNFLINDADADGKDGWLAFRPGIGKEYDPAKWITFELIK